MTPSNSGGFSARSHRRLLSSATAAEPLKESYVYEPGLWANRLFHVLGTYLLIPAGNGGAFNHCLRVLLNLGLAFLTISQAVEAARPDTLYFTYCLQYFLLLTYFFGINSIFLLKSGRSNNVVKQMFSVCVLSKTQNDIVESLIAKVLMLVAAACIWNGALTFIVIFGPIPTVQEMTIGLNRLYSDYPVRIIATVVVAISQGAMFFPMLVFVAVNRVIVYRFNTLRDNIVKFEYRDEISGLQELESLGDVFVGISKSMAQLNALMSSMYAILFIVQTFTVLFIIQQMMFTQFTSLMRAMLGFLSLLIILQLGCVAISSAHVNEKNDSIHRAAAGINCQAFASEVRMRLYLFQHKLADNCEQIRIYDWVPITWETLAMALEIFTTAFVFMYSVSQYEQ